MSKANECTNDDDASLSELSSRTEDITPSTICAKRRRSSVSNVIHAPPSLDNSVQTAASSNSYDQPSKRQKTKNTDEKSHSKVLVEMQTINEVRSRTFSHWPHRSPSFRVKMMEAGFFNCSVGDRTICLYCNLIFQQWMPHTDDPWEVHRTLSPQCPFVMSMLLCHEPTSLLIVNANLADDHSSSTATSNPFYCTELALSAACDETYISILARRSSFATWPKTELSPIEDLVRAGFFYTGTQTIFRCFYCNGSIENWNSTDNPTIEHIRNYPDCAYAKKLCEDDLYRNTHRFQRITQEHTESRASSTSNSERLPISDESTLSHLVAARIKLPISQNLLDRNFKVSIIKRSWEDQLRLKYEDFATECDLFVACTILQKQIEHIGGNKENILIPSVEMRKLREKEPTVTSVSDLKMINSSELATSESISGSTISVSSIPANSCSLCSIEEKRLACIPCGHLAACIVCGHSLRTCPICHREIEAFVRIYI